MNHTHTETNLPIENKYPKLVRDKIPELVRRDGKEPMTHIAGGREYVKFLLAKLVEEATELKEAETPGHQEEEMADVKEVFEALQAALGFSEGGIAEVQASKRAERGGFEERIILDALPE